MMSKLASYLGKEQTERLFLPTFLHLCTDVSFHVRRVCAANFGEFCAVVGQDSAQAILVTTTTLTYI